VLALDHVIVMVQDLDAAARRCYEATGLASVAGGRHPGHGTGNRIVPLGGSYIERTRRSRLCGGRHRLGRDRRRRGQLSSWLGHHELPLRHIGGVPGPHRVAVAIADGEPIVIG
jgi:hypothetical protein